MRFLGFCQEALPGMSRKQALQAQSGGRRNDGTRDTAIGPSAAEQYAKRDMLRRRHEGARTSKVVADLSLSVTVRPRSCSRAMSPARCSAISAHCGHRVQILETCLCRSCLRSAAGGVPAGAVLLCRLRAIKQSPQHCSCAVPHAQPAWRLSFASRSAIGCRHMCADFCPA